MYFSKISSFDYWVLNVYFWISYSIQLRYSTLNSFPRMLSQRWNCFLVCPVNNEICSAYVQHILNVNFEMGWDFPLCWGCTKIGNSLAEHARKLVTHWLSIRENWLLFGWGCTKIGYSLAEHARKLVTRWLSMHTNWLLIGWACAKIGYSLAEHAQKLVTC